MRIAFDENFGDERTVAVVSLIRLVSEMLFFLLLKDFLILYILTIGKYPYSRTPILIPSY